MNDLLNTLFGLAGLGFGAEDVEFGFARPFAGWVWFLAILAALALAWYSYWRLDGARRWRIALAAARALVLLAILFIISGPELVRPNDRVEKDWVLVLMDRSASMSIPDAAAASAAAITRDQQLREGLSQAWPALSTLTDDRTVLWLGFDSGVFDLPSAAPTDPAAPALDLGDPEGRRTSLGAAIDQALARAAARPISGVIVLSDGRSIDEVSRQALRRLQSERIPVVAVPLGSADPIADLALDRAQAPQMAFVSDTIPVAVDIDRLGAGGRAFPGTVQLIDRATRQVLDEKPLPTESEAWQDQRTRLTLTTRQEGSGRFNWLVRIVPDSPDLIEENNQSEVAIEIVDRPLRVAYFDGYPRWEHRYLKNLLLRENSIESSSLLLASNRRYTQEGDILLATLPRSPEEWATFDVIVLGDLPPTVFSHQQLEQIRDHIAIRGAGLLWIGGPGATPSAWRESPLVELLPFTLSSGDAGSAGVRPWPEPVVMSPAPTAQRLNLLELADDPNERWPARLTDPATGWSRLHYAQRIDPSALKPTTEILAYFTPVSGVGRLSEPAIGPEVRPTQDTSTPAVLSMRYGAGRVLYVATDEIWRWRYARGEVLPERFWLPLIRLQGRESLARGSRPALLELSPRRAQIEQPVRISVTLLDQALAESNPASLTVRLRPADSASEPPPVELTLAPDPSETHGPRAYATTWVPTEPGKYTVTVADALLAASNLTADLEVTLPDDELRHPETNHPLLARLAEETEGRILPINRLAELPDILPKREVHIAGTPDVETLWDKPITLILLLLILTLEWVGRRLIKLP